ncbi:hypothetical protein KC19_5G043300 [Ceratodon purpureus]|uniref:Uncharacterized protein n=1 Tax=Ceratodon purpureus TaxID=3225 RepID=A0A8T0HXW6_CERPU|nr:hypothetical protein KC19_5G043300 [Ceratodon purpureus]
MLKLPLITSCHGTWICLNGGRYLALKVVTSRAGTALYSTLILHEDFTSSHVAVYFAFLAM